MQQELKCNYLLVDEDSKTVEIHQDEPSRYFISAFVLKNALIVFKEHGVIEVKGNAIICSFTLDKKFVEDMENKPRANETKLGYKNIFDFIKGIKKPYVDGGWYTLEKEKPYHCLMSQWRIVF